MNVLTQIARENGIFLIEDCAEAFGSTYEGRHVGVFGDIATFSFYGNKTITTGEGGMLVTNDETLYDRAYHLKMHGLAKHREYWHDVLGFNYRMTNICAAIGLAQLEQAKEKIDRKRKLVQWYNKALESLPVTHQPEAANVFHSYWMYSILTKHPDQREALRDHLRTAGIETRPTFFPVHTMPMYAQRYQKLPVGEDLGWRGINLPSWPGLTLGQVNEIASAIGEYYRK
jgi:perosamine synthetase